MGNRNYEKDVNRYRLAAKRGDVYARFELGNCYYYGEGVKRDYNEAVMWYKAAARLGHTTAQVMLGECYWSGRGVKRNKRKAINYWRAAARQGDEAGMKHLYEIEEVCGSGMKCYIETTKAIDVISMLLWKK